MMKKFSTLISLFMLIVPLDLVAQTISEMKARQRAVELIRQTSSKALQENELQLAHTSKDGDVTCYYVFNAMDFGFVIIGGDEVAQKVLGYSTSDVFCYDSIPGNIRWWMEQYAHKISYMANHRKSDEQYLQTRSRVSIPDMITTKWNQHAPYNDKLPRLSWLPAPYDKLATGCMATAAAQVMRYWKYPRQGIGSNSYRLYYNYRSVNGKPNLWIGNKNANGAPKSIKFSSDFSRNTYRWDLMTDTYSSSSTSQQKSSVATIMSDIGIACNMLYGQAHYDGSAARESSLGRAMIDNFGYSRNINVQQHCNYNDDEWEQLIYSELAAKRPVIYGGYEQGIGHEFVISGYESSHNLFNINWGWGGSYDGCFTLSPTVLPCSVNDMEQSFLQNVMPENGDIQRCYLSTFGFGLTARNVKVGTKVSMTELAGIPNSGYVENNTCSDITTDLGIRLRNKATGDNIDILCERNRELKSGYMVDLSFTPTDEGTFVVIPIYKSAGDWHEVRTLSYLEYPELTVTTDGMSDVLVMGEHGLVAGKSITSHDMRYRVTLRNYGNKCTRQVVVFIGETKQEGRISSIAYLLQDVNFEAGETRDVFFGRENLKDADKLKEGKDYTTWVKVLAQ